MQPDPGDDEQPDYELARHKATLEACGEGPFANALELGGSIGVFTEMLAPRCAALATIDLARTAAAMASRRLAGHPQVRVIRGAIPEAIPDEQFDLIVAAEILHRLTEDELDRTLALIRARLVSRGRLVAVHSIHPEPAPRLPAADVHARLRDDPWLAPEFRGESAVFLLDALTRR